MRCRVQRGVRTQLVVDGVGTAVCLRRGNERCARLACTSRVFTAGAAGVAAVPSWRRLHRKLCVVDGQVLFCGGINVLDDHTTRTSARR